jgi:hypothetical protein
MVLPVSMNGCIICSPSVLVLYPYPTLVVHFISRHTLHLQIRTHSMHAASLDLKAVSKMDGCPDIPRG